MFMIGDAAKQLIKGDTIPCPDILVEYFNKYSFAKNPRLYLNEVNNQLMLIVDHLHGECHIPTSRIDMGVNLSIMIQVEQFLLEAYRKANP
jgi:hypothetical protein